MCRSWVCFRLLLLGWALVGGTPPAPLELLDAGSLPWDELLLLEEIFYCYVWYGFWLTDLETLVFWWCCRMRLPWSPPASQRYWKIYRNKVVMQYKMVYELICGMHVGLPVYLHHVFVCLSRICHQGVYGSLLVIWEECWDWSGCGGAIVQVCVEIPRL